METKDIEKYLKENWLNKPNRELAKDIGKSISTLILIAREMGLPVKQRGAKSQTQFKEVSVEEQIKLDSKKKEQVNKTKSTQIKYDFVLEENKRLTQELEASIQLEKNLSPVVFQYSPATNDTESVAVVLASDWHIDEKVKPETINGLNTYNSKIAKQRAEKFFKTTLRLIEIERNATKIDTLVLALLGDFISGNIHEELLENTSLLPMEAIIEVENLLVAGIQYILDNSDLKIIIPCHAGNHSRITKKLHISTEAGNSLETLMYYHIKNYFRDNGRVEILISPSYLSYLNLWGYTICFQHGHAVKYNGGIGGLTIPLKKAVSQWRKTRKADLFCLGHWHSMLDIGEAVVNGSMVGYNAFAMFIKAEYERPKQAFFVVNKKYNEKVLVRSILFD